MGECTLKASQYPMRVMSELHQLYNEGHLVDTTITLAECGSMFYAHRCMLVTAFPYFKKLMDKEQLSQDLTLKSITSEGFQRLVGFIYTGDLQLSVENAKHVLRAAQRMQVPEAVALCHQFMSKEKDTGNIIADLVEQSSLEGDCTSEPPLEHENSALTERIKTEPGVMIPSEQESQTPPVKRGRGRPRAKARKQVSPPDLTPAATSSQLSKRKIRKPRHLVEDGEGEEEFKPPQVPKDTKLKLKKIMKSERDRKRGQKKKKKLLKPTPEAGSDTEMEPVEDSEVAPGGEAVRVPRTGRKRGRPRKGDEVGSPSKKVKVKEEQGSPVRKTTGKKARRPRSSSGAVCEDDQPVQITEVLPSVPCPLCPYHFYHHSALSLHLRKHRIHTHVSTVTSQCYTALARLRRGHMISPPIDGEGDYSCRVCNKTFRLRGQCVAHVVKMHLKRTCRRCTKKLGHQRSRLVHRCKKSRALSSSVQVCSRCFQVFGSIGLLDKHWQQTHPGEDRGTPWKCRHCERCVVRRQVYITHLVGHGLSDREVQLEFTEPSRVPLRSTLSRVQKDDNNPLPYKCSSCEKRYKSVGELSTHMINRHNLRVLIAKKQKAKRMRCEEGGCEQVFAQMKELRQHISTDHPDCTYDCYQCKYTTPVKKLLRSHLKYKHTTIEDRTCQECGKHFKKRYHYRIHMVSKHGAQDSDVKVFKCDIDGCDYKTYARYVLDIHMKKHDKEKKYACTVCGRKLKSQKAVEKHTNKVHMGIRPFICDICGASYGEEHELKMHIVRHNDIKQYQCEHCDYATHDKGNFQSHQYNRHQIASTANRTQHQCDYCGFVTIHRSRFTEHMYTHTKEKPYICNICGMCFGGKSTLRDHIRWKHSEVRVKCDYCSFTAPTKFNLKTHMRIMHTHRNLKPYKCVYCNYRCNLSGNCRKHIKQKHKGMEIKWIKVAEVEDNDSNDKPYVTSASSMVDTTEGIKTEGLPQNFSQMPSFSEREKQDVYRQNTLVEAAYNIAVAQHDANPTADLEEVSSLYHHTAGLHPNLRFSLPAELSSTQALSYFEGGLGYTLYPQQSSVSEEETPHYYTMPQSYH